MHVRPALPGEYDRYAPVMIQLTQEHVAGLPEIFYLPEDAPKRYWFDTSFNNPEKLILFAEEGEELLGILKAEIQHVGNNPNQVLAPRKTLYIADMVVDKDARKRGVGKALFDYALAWGKAQGAGDSTLNVYAFNEGAVEFYKTLGYAPLAMEMRKVL